MMVLLICVCEFKNNCLKSYSFSLTKLSTSRDLFHKTTMSDKSDLKALPSVNDVDVDEDGVLVLSADMHM